MSLTTGAGEASHSRGGPSMTERREIGTSSPAFTDDPLTLRGSIQGQLLRLSAHHTVAIYLREGSLWVADFIDGQGTLVDASIWFRFNCGSLANSHALRRMTLESAIPLSADLVESIEGLHQAVTVDRTSPCLGVAAAHRAKGGLRAELSARPRPWGHCSASEIAARR